MNTPANHQQKALNRPLTHLAGRMFAWLMIACVICAPLAADENDIDVVLLLDASGSIKTNDPFRMRIAAAKMFVSLLQRNDRVSVISFDGRAYPVTPLLKLDSRKNENTVLRSIDKIVAKGKYTNVHDALSLGYETLKTGNDTGREKHIILISDGKMDLGSNERNVNLLEKTLQDLTPKFVQKKIKVHSITFSKDSYIPLLKLTAEDTNGHFALLTNPNNIHQIIDHIYLRTKKPDEIPLTEDSFVVDNSVNELTVVASKYSANSIITLENPNGTDISQALHSDNVQWQNGKKYDLISIKKPRPGYWLIKFSEGGNKAYILSDLTLNIKATKEIAEPSTPLHIRAYLADNGKLVNNKALLKTSSFQIKVTSPTGAELSNQLLDDGSEIGSERHDGIYGISYAFDNEGVYKIEITLNNETFDRKKTLYVTVKSFSPKEPFDKKSQPTTQSTIEQEAEKQTDIGKMMAEKSENLLAAHIKEHHADDALADAHALPADHNQHDRIPITEHTEHTDEHANPENIETDDGGYSLTEALIFIVLLNVILVVFGAIYYFLYYKKQQEKSKEEIEPQEQEQEPINDSESSQNSNKQDEEKQSEISDTNEEKELAISTPMSQAIVSDISDAESIGSIESTENSSSDSYSLSDAVDDLSEIDLEAELSSILNNEDSKVSEKDN